MSIPFTEIKARLLADPEVKAAYEARARSSRFQPSWSGRVCGPASPRPELAARMGTSQSTIVRLESGRTLPSTKTLLRYAEATGSKVHIRLSAA